MNSARRGVGKAVTSGSTLICSWRNLFIANPGAKIRSFTPIAWLRTDSASLTLEGLWTTPLPPLSMSAGTDSSRVVRCRLVVQQFVRPALQHAAVEVRRQPPTPSVHYQPQVQAPMPLPHPERLAQHHDRSGYAHPPDEEYAPLGHRLPLRRHHEAHRQLLEP